MGMTHIRLAATNEDMLAGALRTAWKLRIEKNGKPGGKKAGVRSYRPGDKAQGKKRGR
jgi:hypothetical protein